MNLRFFAHSRLLILIIVFLLLSTAYNIVIPLTRGDDEYGHFRYIRFMAEHHRLPLSDADRRLASYKSRHPPLYHGLNALLFSWVESEETVFKRVDYGHAPQHALIYEVLDINWILLTAIMKFPYQGAVLLWHLSRFLSSVLGAGVIALTYFATLELFPGKKTSALMAAATLAFIPRFIFTSSVLNNDNMQALLMALHLFFMVKLLKGNDNWRLFVYLGITLGLMITNKFSMGLVPVTMVLVFCFLAWRRGWPLMLLVKRIAIVALVALIISSWWFIYVVWNFGEIETRGPINGIIYAIMPVVATGFTGPDLLNYLQGTTEAIEEASVIREPFTQWIANFVKTIWVINLPSGLENDPRDSYIFWIVPIGMSLIALGLVRAWRRGNGFQRAWLGLFLLYTFTFFPFMLIRYYFNGGIIETSQGRHLLLPAALAIGVLLMVGWSHWTGSRTLKWIRPILPTLLLFWSMAELSLLYHLYPKPLPLSVNIASRPPVDTPVNRILFDSFEFVGYSTQISPNQAVLEATLVWQGHPYLSSKDYLTEVRLVNQAEQIVSSWIRHSADGLYPARTWFYRDRVYDQASLPLYNLKPGTYTLEAYLLEAYQQPARQAAGPLFSIPITIENLAERHPGFKKLSIEAENETVQIRYQLWPFDFFDFYRPRYHYRAAIPIMLETDLLPASAKTVVLKLVGPGNRLFEPLGPHGNVKTFIVGPDWPPGTYRLKAEVVENGEVIGENVSAPWFEVENKERQFTPPTFTHQVEANFYDHIKLIGYDLPVSRIQPGEELPIFVYWQALQTINGKLIMFNHFYDGDNNLRATYDRIPPPHYGGPIMWVPGEFINDGYTIPLEPDVPNGIYTLRVGFFLDLGDESWTPLPLVIDGQASGVTYATLGPVKVGSPPAGVLALNPDPQYPRSDNLSDVIKLRGYDVAVSPQAREVELALYWESLATVEKDYTTFVHLQDENGQIITQSDSPPVGGAYPTSLWDVNEVIKDQVTLTLPPGLSTGNYELLVGMYDPSTGERLAVPDSHNNAILLTTLDSSNLN